MQAAPKNEIGLTRYACWDDMSPSKPLTAQLTDAGVRYRELRIPHLVGFAGEAYLVMYSSPKTGGNVVVLCVPHRPDIDSFQEEYFYFEGMSDSSAIADESAWLERYDRCNQIVREEMYP